MASKVAILREFDVSPGGVIVDRNSNVTTIKDMMNTHKEWRVEVDLDNSNTANNPTVATYLSLEHTSGRLFRGMIGSTMIVTQS